MTKNVPSTKKSLTDAAANMYPAAGRKKWSALAEATLRGKPLDSLLPTQLRSAFDRQIDRKVLYLQGDVDVRSVDQRERAVLLRKAQQGGTQSAGSWDLRQPVTARQLSIANRELLEDLNGGATSIEISARSMRAVSGDWVEGLDRLLEGVHLDLIVIALDTGACDQAVAEALVSLLEQRGLDPRTARLAFHLDPLGEAAARGGTARSVRDSLEEMARLASWSRDTLGLDAGSTVARADTLVHSGAGANSVQELASGLATLSCYLRVLADSGLGIDQAQRLVTLRMGVGCDFFAEITKLRAARLLWFRLIESCGVDPVPLTVEARTAERVLTRNDPWVNALRVTTASLSAVLGGADVVMAATYHPEGGARARRLARNTQLILAEETGVARVLDPGGGSWFLESQTDELARAAWSLFQEIESRGGMLDVLRSGWWREQIDSVHEQRAALIARRKAPLTGVSEFAWLDEPEESELEESELEEQLEEPAGPEAPNESQRLDAETETAVSDVETRGIEPLPLRRFAEPFERLRTMARQAREKPSVFLANLGVLSDFNGRATFVKNLLAAGGIDGLGSASDSSEETGFEDEVTLAEAFEASGLRIAILCSSDVIYADRAAAAAQALRAAGADWVVLAGHPGAHRERYDAAGIDEYVSLGVDALDFLGRLHDRLRAATITKGAQV